MKVLVTGATGYVGGRLVTRLLEDGHQVIATGRSLSKLRSRTWAAHRNVELRALDVLQGDNLDAEFEGCDVVYYLVHSMNPNVRDFANADRIAAEHVRNAAAQAGVKRIIYLGGLGEDSDRLSKHLKSRAEVAQVLQQGIVPVTTLRASMIIGSGSASFEILRYLVQRLPIMITPRWVETASQPISIRNVIDYLARCLDSQETEGKTFDIGGPDILSYRELMQIYAEEAGLKKRIIIPVPVFTPKLSSYWIHLVTPLPASIAQPLAEGLRNPAVCKENSIRNVIPQQLVSCREAIALALFKTEQQLVETHWTDAGWMPVESTIPGDPDWAGGSAYTDSRKRTVKSSADEIWQRIIRLGGTSGWYYGNWLWRLRGLMDKLIGGVGLNRGRRNRDTIMPGDALDFWRVVDVQPHKRLLLFAEMKLPGKAWLEFRLTENADGHTLVQQTAIFVPSGLLGLLYWWAVSPLHDFVFDGMLTGIASVANGINFDPTRSTDRRSHAG